MYPETVGAVGRQDSWHFLLGVVALRLPPDLTLIASGAYTQHTLVTGLRNWQVLVEFLIKTAEKSGQTLALTWNGVRVAEDYWAKPSPWAWPRMNPNPWFLNGYGGSSGFQDHKGPLQVRADSRSSLKQNIFLWNPSSMEIAFPRLAACVWYPLLNTAPSL